MKKLITILIIFAFLILASAQQPSDVDIPKIKQGDPYILSFPCIQNGAICPSATVCRATGFKQDQSAFFTNITASNNGTYYNITVPGVVPLGVYRNQITCFNGTDYGYDTIWIKVTPTGDSRGFSLPLILALGAFLLLGLALLYNNAWFGIIAGFMFGVCGVYLLIYGINDIADLYTRTLGWVGIGIGVIFIIVGAYETAIDGGEEDLD